MHNPSGIHSMNVSGDPTPVIIDQVREIRFQRQANCIFLSADIVVTCQLIIIIILFSASTVSEVNSLMFPVRCRDVHIREVQL